MINKILKYPTLVILLLIGEYASGISTEEKIQSKQLVVALDSCNYTIQGIKDYNTFFRYAFDKVWKIHTSIIYTTCDSLKYILAEAPDKYVVIKIDRVSYYRKVCMGCEESEFGYNTGLVMGFGEEFLKQDHNGIGLLYEFDFLYKIYAEEFVFALKRINDDIQCSLSKVNCSFKEQTRGSKEILLSKTLLLPGHIMNRQIDAATVSAVFPCKIEIAPNEEAFWSTLTSSEEKYNLLCLSAPKMNGKAVNYFILEMTTYRILELDIPGGYEFVRDEYSRIDFARLKSIAKKVENAN